MEPYKVLLWKRHSCKLLSFLVRIWPCCCCRWWLRVILQWVMVVMVDGSIIIIMIGDHHHVDPFAVHLRSCLTLLSFRVNELEQWSQTYRFLTCLDKLWRLRSRSRVKWMLHCSHVILYPLATRLFFAAVGCEELLLCKLDASS